MKNSIRFFPFSPFAYKFFGQLFFSVLFVFSILFYKERIIYIDTAVYITKIIQTGLPNISGRYSGIFSQILPILAIKLGLPLKAVLISYSLSFVLLYYLVFLICVYKLKNIAAGITIILVLCLCTRNSFFYVATEMHQGLVFSVLFFAWINSRQLFEKKNKILLFLSVSVLLIITCFFLHPSTFFTLMFSLLFYMADKNEFWRKELWILIAFTFLLFLFNAIFTPGNAAEGKEFGMARNFEKYRSLFSAFPLYFLRDHSGKFTIIYLYAEILFGIIFIYYLIKRNFIKLFLLAFFVFSYIIVNSIVYSEGESGIVLEKSFLPLSFLIGMPFVNDFLFKIKKFQWKFFLLFFLLIFLRVRDISKTAKTIRARLNYISSVCHFALEKGGQKFYLSREDLNIDKIQLTWTLGCESLLLSSLNSPDSSISVFVLENNVHPEDLKTDKFYISNLIPSLWNVDELNSKYFHINKNMGYNKISGKID